MIATQTTLQQKAQQLLNVLDKDVAHIERSLGYLDRLRQLLIKRHEQGLKELLDEIRLESKDYRQHEHRRQALRSELARMIECLPAEMTLSHLETYLDPATRDEIRQQKHQISTLSRRLQGEVQTTALLLNDLAHLNRALFKAIFRPAASNPMIYGVNGSVKRGGQVSMLNLSF